MHTTATLKKLSSVLKQQKHPGKWNIHNCKAELLMVSDWQAVLVGLAGSKQRSAKHNKKLGLVWDVMSAAGSQQLDDPKAFLS